MVNKKIKTLGTLIVLIVLASFASPSIGQAAQNPTDLQTPNPIPPNSPSVTRYLYLPLAKNGLPVANTTLSFKISSEMYSGASSSYTDKAVAANIKYARTSVFAWDLIESTRGNYNWSSVDEGNLRGLSASGITAIAIVRYAPSWAQKTPPRACGPIAESKLDAFAQFLTAAVQRYSQPPYNVHYWEIGNEPDAPFLNDNRSVFGCWGDPNLPFYGGGYYAKALEKAYPAIKAADPTAQVVIGGLLLDCDPTNPPAGKDCSPGNFFEGILDNNGKRNGASFFDLVSYHGYPTYDGSNGGVAGLQGDEKNSPWAARGGVTLGKANFLREVMNRYGVNKPLFHSEGALIWWCSQPVYPCPTPPNQTFYEAQADYAVWLFVRDWAYGINITSWYQYEWDSWRYNSLLYENLSPKPAYNALHFLTNELSGANYSQQITSYPNVRIYEFKKSSKKVWVMWTPDQLNHTISLPAGWTKVLDKYGNGVTPSNNQLTVNKPVYVELAP